MTLENYESKSGTFIPVWTLEIQTDKKALAEEEKQALKAHKKDAVATVKKLIVEHKLTKGDIRGKALKQLGM